MYRFWFMEFCKNVFPISLCWIGFLSVSLNTLCFKHSCMGVCIMISDVVMVWPGTRLLWLLPKWNLNVWNYVTYCREVHANSVQKIAQESGMLSCFQEYLGNTQAQLKQYSSGCVSSCVNTLHNLKQQTSCMHLVGPQVHLQSKEPGLIF